MITPEKTIEKQMSLAAWHITENSVSKKRKVGCCVLVESTTDKSGRLIVGCNIEHDYCKSLHAEIVAVAKAVSIGYKQVEAVLIVCDSVTSFLPCGDCMDWLLQFSHDATIVGFQNNQTVPITWHRLYDLMPHYPKK